MGYCQKAMKHRERAEPQLRHSQANSPHENIALGIL
jgi:hypothetical protein